MWGRYNLTKHDALEKKVSRHLNFQGSSTLPKVLGGSVMTLESCRGVDAFEKIPPPNMNECPLQKGPFSKKENIHLPTINFQGQTVTVVYQPTTGDKFCFGKMKTHLLNLHFGVPSPFIILAGVLLHRKKRNNVGYPSTNFPEVYVARMASLKIVTLSQPKVQHIQKSNTFIQGCRFGPVSSRQTPESNI